ncbi:PKD domain-containing protein, partial [Candidatus Gracilibacteria bacterium]|nr:PKD domain-containing protein [Candidatus Gracilibacteria bacterium]
SHFDRVFLIQPDQDEAISGNIIATVDEDNELLYYFEVQDISNDFGDGIIENFQWNIDNKEFSLPGSITDPGKASRMSYEFENFGEHEIEVVLTDSLGKTTPLRSTLTLDKQLLLKTPLEIYEGESLLDSVEYNSKNQEYIIDAFGVPSQLQFSARGVKTDDPLYSLDSVTWDFNSDGDIDETGMYVSYDVFTEGNYELTLHYNFIHRKKKTSVKLSEKIYIQAIKKQVNLKLDIEKQSQYVPVTVRFDASQSQVLGQNIVSFEYDYGNGIIEKRDAINQGHIYRQPGEYDVVLTVTTDTGEKHSLTKKLVLTTRPDIVQITPSLYDAPVGQEIDFSSAQSSGQIVSYYWKFGDGNTSAEANPSHSYDAAGDYQVELMIEFANNNVKTDTIDITIVP